MATQEVREVNAGELSAIITDAGAEILRYEIVYPRIKAASQIENRINKYHSSQAKNLERAIKNHYLPMARQQHKATAGYGGFAPIEITSSYCLMCNTDAVMSVFMDTYYNLGVGGTRLARVSKTYDMGTGRACTLQSLFRRGTVYRKEIHGLLLPMIEREAQNNPGIYDSGWRDFFISALREDGFYLTDDGIAVYFGQEVIAGKNAGIPSFLLPYSAFEGRLAIRP